MCEATISTGTGATRMPVCSRCGKQGLFVRISKWNVCSSCQRGIEEFAAERMEVCSADLKAAEASSSGEMRARYLDQALAALSDLVPFDDFDPPVTTPRPSERIRDIMKMKEAISSEQADIARILDRADEILSTLSTPLGSETRIRYVLSLLDEAIGRGRSGDANAMERAYRLRSGVFTRLAAIDRSAAGIQSGLAFTRADRRRGGQDEAIVSSAAASTPGRTSSE